METLSTLQEEFSAFYEEILSTIPHLIIGLLLVLALNFILRSIRLKVIKIMKQKADDKILIDFSNSFFRMLNMIILALLFIYIIGFGNIAGSILGAAGLSAFVIGFALKDIGENFLAGVIMAFDRPFRLGDTIKTGDVEGTIRRLGIRDTHVKTFDGKDVYVPNGQILKNPLYNYTIDGFLRINFTIGVDYGSPIEKVRTIIIDTVKSIPGVLSKDKAPRTHVSDLQASTIEIECHFWIDTFDKSYSGLELKSLAQSNSVAALAEAGISMPNVVVEVKNYDQALTMHSHFESKTQVA